MRRQGSTFINFRQRIPRDVKDRAAGLVLSVPVGDETATIRISSRTEVVQFSLRTRDPGEGKARQAVALAYLERQWEAIRKGPVGLTHKQVVALAGEAYRDLVQAREDNPGKAEGWQLLERLATVEVGSGLSISNPLPSATAEPLRVEAISAVLARHNLTIDDDSRRRLNIAVREAYADAARRLAANAKGDYSEDTIVRRFPPVDVLKGKEPKPSPSPGRLTFTSLIEDWWREAEKAGRRRTTYDNYKGVFGKLAAFLKHDNAHEVMEDDVVRFKDHRLGEVSARTVKDADLAALKSVFGWAVSNRKLASNPAASVTVMRGKVRRTRPQGFTLDEAGAILGAALMEQLPTRRWVPWLLAYTGARAGEIIQLRKQDLVPTGDHWSLVLTPEAGTIKTGEARTVPVHPHLIEQGLVTFVQEHRDEHLFLRPNAQTGNVLGSLKGVRNHLGAWVREYVTDARVKPNHGWRHLFITLCRGHGIGEDIQRLITGHSARDVHAEYGDAAGLYEAICRLPRFKLAEEQKTEA